MARSKKRRAVRARKNFVFLLPFLPIIAPVALAGVAVYAGKQWIDQTSRTAKLVFSPAPIVGATAGYLVARTSRQDKMVQAAAAVGGYAAGLLVNKFIAPKAPETKALAAKTVQDLMATGLTQEQAEARIKASLSDAKWCAEHTWLAKVAPSCTFSG